MKEKLFKFKRFMHRNRELISRIISIALTVAFVVVIGVAVFNIYLSDKQKEIDANKPKDESAIEIEKGWDYGDPGYNKVAENDALIMEADYTTGEIRITEKKSGHQWYTNPPDRKQDNIIAIRTQINSQFYVRFLDVESRTVLDFDNYGASIKKGGMSHELVENGVKFTFAFPQANVYIPVQYTLVGDSFQAEILTDEIVHVGDSSYLIESIAFLPYFGAGGLKDDGYLFIPDGSGALINYNNNRQRTQIYTAPVYGRNPTVELKEQESVKETISMPVFGAKTNDHAYLGVIISGDSSSTITASTSKKLSSYNTVYSSAIFREYSLTVALASKFYGIETRVLKTSDNLLGGQNYAVRYFFMDGENANYTGMAESYKEYLRENGKLQKTDLTKDKYLVLDLIGAVSIEKYVFGIKQPVVTALTTYNDVVTIVKDLKAQGVDNLIVNYIGALDGGLKNKPYSKVSTESVLGSKKEFNAMVSYLKEQGVELFLETNPVELYNNGNGYDSNGDAVKAFFDKNAFEYTYNLDSKLPTANRWRLIKPELVPEFIEKFTNSADKWNITNISIDRLAATLYTNYADDVPNVTRSMTMAYWEQAMKQARESADYLMVHKGNAYSLAYADVITDTASGGSDYDMVDSSVPFYQIVLQDSKLTTSVAFNTTVDYTKAFLSALETGCSMKYNLIYGDVSDLVGTEYNTMVSYSYEFWKDIIVEEYKTMQEATQIFAGNQIVNHEMIADNVSLTQYENGALIVNYGNESYTYQGTLIGARDYLVVKGGAE